MKMNALPSVVAKELRLIRSQRMSLALIIIYPVLVVAALGLAFGGNLQGQRVSVALFITSDANLGPFTADDLVGIIEDTNKVNLFRTGSAAEAMQRVKAGKSDFALVIGEKKTAEGQISTDLFFDNSNYIVSQMFSPIAKAAIQLTSFEVSSRIIQRLWGELLPIRNDLQDELDKIDSYLAELDEAEKKIDSLQQTIAGIDLATVQSRLAKQTQNVESTKQMLQQFNADYVSFQAQIIEIRADLDSSDAKLAAYEDKVSKQIVTAKEYRKSLYDYEQRLGEIAADSEMPENAKKEILRVKAEVTRTREQMDSSIVELEQIKSDIEESRQTIASMRQNLDAADAALQKEKQALDNVNSMLDATTADISAFNSQLSSLGKAVDDVNKLITDAKGLKQEVSGKLQNSKVMLNDFTAVLGELSNLNPAFLARPIQAFEKNIYKELNVLSFIMPVSLALVLLLTCLLFSTMSVITEKSEGAHLRMKLSATHPFTLIIGKIIGQMLFAFLVSLMILLIGLVVFGVQLQGNVLDIIAAIAIVSFSFISLGLFITNFSKTQSTAILGSLILILPMIFLSGMILPLQLMSPLLQSLSNFLPLTAANQLLIGILIKGASIEMLSEQVMILLLPAIALIAFTIKRF